MNRYTVTVLSSLLLLTLDTVAQFGTQHSIYREGPLTIQVVDMDLDGDNDVLLGSRLGITLLRNVNGTGSLSSPITLSALEVAAHAVDVDGDGLPDVVASREAQGGIYWYRNLGSLGFGSAQVIANYGTALSLTSWDADADGDMDLLFQLSNNTVAYSSNIDGLGSFTAPVDLGAVGGLISMTIRDVDGDGDGDPVFASASAEQVWWTENLLTGFQTQTLLTSDGFGDAADVDGDGIMDLLTANPLGGMVQWQRGMAMNFTAPFMIDQSGIQCGRIHVADLDGDGDQDATLVEINTHELVWYENINGQGQFGPRQVIATNMTGVVNITSGDLDGDGDREVFVASDAQNHIFWSENLRTADDRIVGRVFNDLNGDGQFNGNDHGLYNVPVKIGGSGITLTNHAGIYQFDAAPGNHTISMDALPGWSYGGPMQHTVMVAPPQNSALGVDFPLQAAAADIDIVPVLTSGPLRCERMVPYWYTITNTGNQVSDVEATLQLDALSIISSSDPSPSAIVNGIPHWSFDGLQPTQSRTIRVWVIMPDASHLGELMFDQGACIALDNGVVVDSSSCELPQELDCAYDPNDKQVLPKGYGAQHLTAMGTRLSYTIRFQNTGNAPAQTVEIADLLVNELDVTSIVVEDASHPMETFIADNGTLTFTFLRINLPDSASDPLGSQGFVRFSADHMANLSEGTVVENTANIYFDNNPAIVTNTVQNTMTYGLVGLTENVGDGSDPQVFPNPMGEHATILLGDVFSGSVQLSLTDAMGRTIRSWNVNGDRAEIHRNGLTPGLYFLRATDVRKVERVLPVLLD